MPSYSVFTKPWKTASTEELIGIVTNMGFNAIEFPLRDGFQVSPAECEAKLPAFAKQLKESGIRIENVASAPSENVFSACAQSGIHMIRIMFTPPKGLEYLEQETSFLKQLDSYVPLCEKYGVTVGLQMHYGTGPSTTGDMMRIVKHFDKKHIGAIWDAAHSGLAGELCEQAIDQAFSHLCLVNFKNARYQMAGRAPSGEAEFTPFFCPGPDGQCSWPRAVKHLKEKGYTGTWCMPAEYTETQNNKEMEYAKKDLAWLRSLVEG